jgi:hypothetical protein
MEKAGLKVSLLSATKEYVAAHKRRNESMSLDALFESYLTAHNGKSTHHRDKLRYCRARFAALGEKIVCDLHHEDFEPTLNKLTPSMRNAELRLLRAVLNYGIKREYLDKNPFNTFDFADIERGEIEIIPASVVEAMLRDAAKNELSLLRSSF